MQVSCGAPNMAPRWGCRSQHAPGQHVTAGPSRCSTNPGSPNTMFPYVAGDEETTILLSKK